MWKLALILAITGLTLGCSAQLEQRPELPTAIAGLASSDTVFETPGARITRSREDSGPTSTPAPWATALPPTPRPPAPPMAHPVAGQENCFECHYKDAYVPLPPDHIRRSTTTCLGCHSPEPPWRPPLITHAIAGREACLMCHLLGKNGAPVEPGDHAGRLNDTCLNCHQPK